MNRKKSIFPHEKKCVKINRVRVLALNIYMSSLSYYNHALTINRIGRRKQHLKTPSPRPAPDVDSPQKYPALDTRAPGAPHSPHT